MKKIAVLSNVNIDPMLQILSQDTDIYNGAGYGTVFEELMNKESGLNQFQPRMVFVIIDLAELLMGSDKEDQKIHCIEEWFSLLKACISSGVTYFISDADIRNYDMEINQNDVMAADMEYQWNKALRLLTAEYSNVFRLRYKKCAERMGKEQFYSNKLWYLGRIIHTSAAREAIANEIKYGIELTMENQKKVLLLDLDHTLWGGVIGEGSSDEIALSNEKSGLIYKDLQRVILKIKNTGVLLSILSKNNYQDAITVIRSHPHMILRESDFIVKKINWKQKNETMREVAEELNLGLDSFVFFDDSPAERELIRNSLPQVTVPDFPANLEDLPKTMENIFYRYFKKLVYSKEDSNRTELYAANEKRRELKVSTVDFSSFLKELKIKVTQAAPKQNTERLYQLINKTNQFNLTTHRYSLYEVNELIEDKNKQIYLFEVSEKFGNNGITGVVIADLEEDAYLDTFILSCRIMGRYIENYILDYVEQDIYKRGYSSIRAKYVYTAKSKPVEEFYETMGYTVTEQTAEYKAYELNLSTKPLRVYYIEKE